MGEQERSPHRGGGGRAEEQCCVYVGICGGDMLVLGEWFLEEALWG